MKDLEKITDKTCAIKLQVMKMAYVPLELEKCRGCQYYESAYVCHNYKPYNYSFPVRQGRPFR